MARWLRNTSGKGAAATVGNAKARKASGHPRAMGCSVLCSQQGERKRGRLCPSSERQPGLSCAQQGKDACGIPRNDLLFVHHSLAVPHLQWMQSTFAWCHSRTQLHGIFCNAWSPHSYIWRGWEFQVTALRSSSVQPKQRKAGQIPHTHPTLPKPSKAAAARIDLIRGGSLGFIGLCSVFKAALINV